MEADHPPLMLCEYLGAKTGAVQTFPSKLNRCTAEGRLDILSLDKQTELCLGPGHLRCPLRLKAKAREFSPPLGAAEALPPEQQDKVLAGEYKASRKRHETREDQIEELPDPEEFEQPGGEFASAGSAEPEPAPHKPAKNEPTSQPFRHEMDDWMKGLFKDLKGK